MTVLDDLRACKPTRAQLDAAWPACRWEAWPCATVASARVIVRGPSSLVVEDRLLCEAHAETTAGSWSREARAEGWAVAVLPLPDPTEPKLVTP